MDDFAARVSALETEADDFVRNQMAMELAETQRPEVFDALLRLIRRPELADRRGTLVYCLEHYDCSGQIELLAELIATGNYEVAWMAARNLDAIEHAEGEHVQRAYRYLLAQRAGGVAEDWRREAIDEAISLFE